MSIVLCIFNLTNICCSVSAFYILPSYCVVIILKERNCYSLPVRSLMQYLKPTHHLIPALFVREARSLWLICILYIDFCLVHVLNTVTTSHVSVNSDNSFLTCHFYTGKWKGFEQRFDFKLRMHKTQDWMKSVPELKHLQESLWCNVCSKWVCCVITTRCNKTGAFACLWCNFHSQTTVQIVKRNILLTGTFRHVYSGEINPRCVLFGSGASFCISDTWTLRITGISMQKMS
jgi:hypothetical protein